MTEGQKALHEWEMAQAEYRSLLDALCDKAEEYPEGFSHEAADGFTIYRHCWGWSFEKHDRTGRLMWAHLPTRRGRVSRGSAAEEDDNYRDLLHRAHQFLCAGETPSDTDSFTDSFTRERRKRWLAYTTWPAWAGTAVGGLALLWWLTSNALTWS